LANRRVVGGCFRSYGVAELVKACANIPAKDRADARLKVTVRGAVQGVGFRPFVYRLATELGLRGWVSNSPQGVFLEVEGRRADAENFLRRLEVEKPPRSSIRSLETSWLAPARHEGFEIRKSRGDGNRTALVLPDIATCPDCLRELFDPANRRYLYPFTNCTHCGPRFSIIESLPYDRANTSMKSFTMCPDCEAEYRDPRNRRFHAQPNACPKCGPRAELWNSMGERLAEEQDALLDAAEALRAGKIVAVKGLGGFHLMVAAHNEEAVWELRSRKHREAKPFALMFPSFAMVKTVCEVSALEERLLRSPEAPIVLLKNIDLEFKRIPSAIAPGNPYLGVMLPYTPLHHVLMAELGFPVIATSGNLSDEPICTDEYEAVRRLAGIADVFLVHNRPIVRHVDDSITREMADREMVLRRARGYAPLPIQIKNSKLKFQNVLAVGAHFKNSVAMSVGGEAFISQHIGDLETDQAFEAFRTVIDDFERLYEAKPSVIACDLHPDYLSSQHAMRLAAAPAVPGNGGAPALAPVQHHLAHVLSCMAENQIAPPILGVSWDGTGYGTDGTIWGGEFFHVTDNATKRVAHLRQFRLPGGDWAVKEPRRTGLGLLYAILGDKIFEIPDLKPADTFSLMELAALKRMLDGEINSPLTSSIGRLFDAVAAIVGLNYRAEFEGQAAMELEFAIGDLKTDEAYPIGLTEGLALILDWQPTIEGLLKDIRRGVSVAMISAKFHNALVEGVIRIAKRIGEKRLALSGGCFQNRYLTERLIRGLRAEKFEPFWHRRVPTNDGGIALGQIMAVLRQKTKSRNPQETTQ
jgi:hydrogenase maturation protein HypF